MPPDFSREQALYALNSGGLIAGIDEAGRGPWAGPVIAAAVILDPREIPPGLDDSKKLPAHRREDLYARLLACAQIGVGQASVEEIDDLNILNASLLAMTRAVAALPVAPSLALADGNRAPGLSCPVETMIGGDARSLSIAAASIIAKVTRDAIMNDLDAEFPGYGWKTNQGYGTRAHQAGLLRLGITPHHRRSFKPIHKMLCKDAPITH